MEQRRFPVFAERFAQLRGDRTQGEFASILGLSRPTVGFYENGNRLPDAYMLRHIAVTCGVSADWLIGLTDAKSRDPSAVESLGLTDDAIEAIEWLPDNERNVLSFLLEQESFAGRDEEEDAIQILGEIPTYGDKIHLLKRIINFISVPDDAPDCNYITDDADILNEWDVDEPEKLEILECTQMFPIRTKDIIREAFLTDIRSMAIKLRERYWKERAPEREKLSYFFPYNRY